MSLMKPRNTKRKIRAAKEAIDRQCAEAMGGILRLRPAQVDALAHLLTIYADHREGIGFEEQPE